MLRIEIDNDRNRTDRAAVAAAFGIDRAEFERRMRLGEIKSWFERRGSGFHERERLIFFSPDQGIRAAVDRNGAVVERVEEAPERAAAATPAAAAAGGA